MSNLGVNVIILAAGKGTRMKSDLPKVLHKVVGRTMLDMVCDVAFSFNEKVNVVTVISDEIEQIITKREHVSYVVQKERLGTADAVKVATPLLKNDYKRTVILYGDTPLISKEIIEKKINKLDECDLVVGAFDVADISQKYGRLITKKDQVLEIIEYKNATEEIRNISLCNSGIYAVKTDVLKDVVFKVQKNELTLEYYLTDIVDICNKNKLICKFVKCQEDDLLGVNSQKDLSIAASRYQQNLRNFHIENGVKMIAPETVFFYDDTKINSGVQIEPNVVFGHGVKIGSDCQIGCFSYIVDSSIGNNNKIKSHSHIEGCVSGDNVILGPFVRIRPGSVFESDVKIGNFVEIKNAKIGKNAKANHLSYIGDAKIGENTNFGAGSITCNYDGFEKHQTTIGQNVLIGANCSIVAPVVIGDEVVVGAGSVLTRDVESGDLAIARSEQRNIKDGGVKYRSRKKKNKI